MSAERYQTRPGGQVTTRNQVTESLGLEDGPKFRRTVALLRLHDKHCKFGAQAPSKAIVKAVTVWRSLVIIVSLALNFGWVSVGSFGTVSPIGRCLGLWDSFQQVRTKSQVLPSCCCR